jgi:hypothetical protein
MTAFELMNEVWKVLNGSALKTEITGKIYKRRPVNRAGNTKEDVSINSLSAPNLQHQETVLNVNIHLPNLKIDVDGQQDQTQPNYKRADVLYKLAEQALDNYNANGWYIRVDSHNIFPEDEIKEHYINIRITIFSINF